MNGPVRTSNIFPILDRASEDVANLLAFEIADWTAGVYDYRDAVSANDIIVEFHIASFRQFQFIFDWRSRSRGDIALARHESSQPVSGSFGFEFKRRRRVVFLKFRD